MIYKVGDRLKCTQWSGIIFTRGRSYKVLKVMPERVFHTCMVHLEDNFGDEARMLGKNLHLNFVLSTRRSKLPGWF